VPGNVLVEQGRVAGIVASADGIEAGTVVDGRGLLAFPGVIDGHVHFNEIVYPEREDYQSGTASAAAGGGVTTIVDMPDLPPVRSAEQFHRKLESVRPKAYVDYAFWGGMTGEDVREGWTDRIYDLIDLGVCSFKLYMTPSVPTYPRVDDGEMWELFQKIAPTGMPIGVHAENFPIVDHLTKTLRRQGRLDPLAWAEARARIAERTAIQLVIAFAEATGARAHIVHMTTKDGVELVRAAKERGVRVTSETCPHYLCLTAAEAMPKYGSFAKIAPPLRDEEDIEALWQGLADGTVDFMGTDHAPYVIATEKQAEGMDIWTSLPGVPAVETLVPFMVSEGLLKGRLGLGRFVDVMSRASALHYGLYPKKGSLEIGADADLTIVDPEREWVIDPDALHTKSKYTPMAGMKLRGKVAMTIVRGQVVYEDGRDLVVPPGSGQFVPRQSLQALERWLKY
jgi:allantoinase